MRALPLSLVFRFRRFGKNVLAMLADGGSHAVLYLGEHQSSEHVTIVAVHEIA